MEQDPGALSADEIDALRDEYLMQQTVGWQRRMSTIVGLLQERMGKLSFGDGEMSDRERHQMQGYNQALKWFIDHAQETDAAWNEYMASQAREEQEDEGGPHDIHYEAAGQGG